MIIWYIQPDFDLFIFPITIDLQWQSDKYYAVWLLCSVGRIEEKMGRTGPHLTGMHTEFVG